jgi:septal ring factor EnvC (AmiA/AmiB activator)
LRGFFSILFLLFVSISGSARASLIPPAGATAKPKLVEKLNAIHSRVMQMQQSLVEDLEAQKETQGNVRKIRALLALQKQERSLGNQRLQELEKTVDELESRRGLLQDKIKTQRDEIRRFLIAIERSVQGDGSMDANLVIPEREKLESPRRKVLSRLVDRGLKEVEALKVDVADGEQLEATIEEERQQLAYLFHELKEQQGVLELNQELPQTQERRIPSRASHQ